MIPVDLYSHQSVMNAECRDLMRQGFKHVLMQGATGIGKSRMAAAQIQAAYEKGKRAAFIVPFRELVYQMSEQFARFEIPHSFVANGYSFNPNNRVHICTPGTLINRLDMIQPDVIFDDEIHIGGATRDKIIRHYQGKGAYSVGLSATPQRLDGRGLNCWYQAMVKGPQSRWLIEQGYLSRYKLFAPDTPDFSRMPKSGGEFAKAAMAARMEEDRVLIGRGVDQYIKSASGKLNVTFCYSRDHSEIVNEQFKARGIPSACVDGETPDDERKRIFRALAKHELMNVCSVNLITTGFDLEAAAGMPCTVESISDMRPTLSLALQLQKWGRALRKKEQPAVINDHVCNVHKFGMPDEIREWSLLGEEGGKKDISATATPARQCPKCSFWDYPKAVCINCSFVFPVEARFIKEIDGEFIELTPEELARVQAEKKQKRQQQGMAKTPEELLRFLIDEGRKNPVAYAARILGGRGNVVGYGELNRIYMKILGGKRG